MPNVPRVGLPLRRREELEADDAERVGGLVGEEHADGAHDGEHHESGDEGDAVEDPVAPVLPGLEAAGLRVAAARAAGPAS